LILSNNNRGKRVFILVRLASVNFLRPPLYHVHDTSLRSLYRLYDDLCANKLIMMGYECESFFYHNTHRLATLKDPLVSRIAIP
jgi:hypothetical protein